MKVGVLAGTLLATAVLRLRNPYRLMSQAEEIDTDADGVPDAFEHIDPPPQRD